MIYTDEAGISANEPRCVVAAIIVDPDRQFDKISREIDRVFDLHVPPQLRSGFQFHAKEVFSGGKSISRSEWPLEERLDFYKEFLTIPLIYDAPLAFAVVDKSWNTDNFINGHRQIFHHLMAFGSCMAHADLFLRKYLQGQEKGIVVCEDIPQHRSILAKGGLMHREKSITLGAELQRQDSMQSLLKESPPPAELRIDHIIDVPHFVSKGQAPIIQLADACAFAIRRWINKESRGEELALAMFGPANGPSLVSDPIWYDGPHSGLAHTEAYWSDEQKKANLDRHLAFAMHSVLDAAVD